MMMMPLSVFGLARVFRAICLTRVGGPGNDILVFTPSGACTLPATVTINVAQTLTPNLIVPPVFVDP